MFAMKNKSLLIVILLSIFFSFSASAAYVTKVVITTTEPAVGAKYSFKASVPETASSEVYEVLWTGTFDNGLFVQGNDYTITVKLRIKASSSNIFSTSSRINATINGHKAIVTQTREKNIIVKYTWKTLGGENPNTPEYKLKSKLAELAAAYTATNATNDREVLAYLRSKLPKAEIWCAGGTYRYTRKIPTQTNDGHFSMTIGIKNDGITIERYGFCAVIPALNKSPEATKLNADMALMKAALKDISVTSKTTGDQVLDAVNRAAIHGTKAEWDKNYRYTASTSKVQGSIVGDLIVSHGDKRDIINVHKVLPIKGTAADAAIDADFSALSKALYAYAVTNNTTQQELIDVASNSLKNGSKLICTGFSKTNATYDNEGKIVINFELELKGKKRIPRISTKIAKVRANIPTEIAVSHDEWELLRLTNIERYKQGASPLVMVAPLVDAADIRVKEIVVDYRQDHRRPDGSKFSTAVNPSFASKWKMGENAYKYPLTPSQAIDGWMKSPGHRTNILMKQYSYIGCGVTGRSSQKCWIQIFAIGGGVTNVQSSTGSYHFKTVAEMEKAYLICDINEGVNGYVPLDADYMVKKGNMYTIHLKGKSVTVTVDNIE